MLDTQSVDFTLAPLLYIDDKNRLLLAIEVLIGFFVTNAMQTCFENFVRIKWEKRRWNPFIEFAKIIFFFFCVCVCVDLALCAMHRYQIFPLLERMNKKKNPGYLFTSVTDVIDYKRTQEFSNFLS